MHILVGGRIRESGGPELAEALEVEGYARFGIDEAATTSDASAAPDPFADPFADPLA